MLVVVLLSWNSEKSAIDGVSEEDPQNQNTWQTIYPLLKFQWYK